MIPPVGLLDRVAPRLQAYGHAALEVSGQFLLGRSLLLQTRLGFGLRALFLLLLRIARVHRTSE